MVQFADDNHTIYYINGWFWMAQLCTSLQVADDNHTIYFINDWFWMAQLCTILQVSVWGDGDQNALYIYIY
jgi:hypothetical protein